LVVVGWTGEECFAFFRKVGQLFFEHQDR